MKTKSCSMLLIKSQTTAMGLGGEVPLIAFWLDSASVAGQWTRRVGLKEAICCFLLLPLRLEWAT